MKKEIIVNAGDLESRVAILEDGRLAELHVERDPRMVGNIYKARVVSVLPGMDAAFADIGLEKNVFLCSDDVGFISRDGLTVAPAPRSVSIARRLKENQEVVVQVVRAPVGGKGARATTRLALPGRYLVLLMTDASQVGVSRRIEERKERDRLRKIGERLRPKGSGLIIRTEAEDHGAQELEADLKVLLDLRGRLMKKASQTRAAALIHQDLTLTYQVIRDVFSDDVDSLVIDSESVYDNAVELVKIIAPSLRRRIKHYRGKLPIFHKYDIEGEIDRLLRRRVWLAAGGYITIDQAEAFTAIDVNTGRYTGATGLAETILHTNLEAAEEIARQLRLRDLGGIIVIDFIDMERPRHRQRVMKVFQEALKRDRQKTKILHLSPLGLVEMTRKRRGESLMGVLTESCPQCGGLGRVRKPLTVGLKIECEVRRVSAEKKVQAIVVRACPAVAAILIGEGGQRAAALERRAGSAVFIRASHDLGLEEHEILPMTRAEACRAVKIHSKGEELIVDHLDPLDPAAREDLYGWVGGYRVQVEGARPGLDAHTIVLASAANSFGRGRVKGAEKTRPQTKETGARLRPRAGRKRGRGKRKSETPARAPAPDEGQTSAGQPTGEATQQARDQGASSSTQAPVLRRKTGLLRRGARRIARTLR